jgi:hypothetical protein
MSNPVLMAPPRLFLPLPRERGDPDEAYQLPGNHGARRRLPDGRILPCGCIDRPALLYRAMILVALGYAPVSLVVNKSGG